MKGKFLILMLAFVLMIKPIQVLAADTTNDISYTEGGEEQFEQSVGITASKGGEFVVAIPKTGTVTKGKMQSLKAGVYADIPAGKKIVIAPVDGDTGTPGVIDFKLHNVVPQGCFA